MSMSTKCIARLCMASVYAATMLAGPCALAQTYPSRPVRLIVPFAPGGGSDIIARVLAPHLSELLAQQVLIDNRPGAGTIIGAELAAKSPPDGYTLFLGITGTMAINPSMYRKLPYRSCPRFRVDRPCRHRSQRAGRAPIAAGAINSAINCNR